MNADNVLFYDRLGPTEMKRLGELVSIDDCLDLERIQATITQSKSILEIGAGYGRVINYLLSNYGDKSIAGIEASPAMYEHLKKRFQNQVNIYHDNILTFEENTPFDLALWMWSGFLDLSQKDQDLALDRLYHRLSSQGRMVIDIPDKTKIVSGKSGRIGDFTDSNIVKIDSPVYGLYVGDMPTEEHVQMVSKQIGFADYTSYRYDINGCPRIQIILSK